jgi:glycosyltransferase involved in cell wall biosynthesis
MSVFTLPEWVKPHLYPKKKFTDLTPAELEDLKSRISLFKPEMPEVTIAIPAWNEQDNIFRTLSSLSASNTTYRTEIIVINNNSTDKTQEVLDKLGVINYFQTEQGTPFARQMSLEKAKGAFYLCADADTFYPPDWIDLMVAPMAAKTDVTGVYGRYSFMPPEGSSRLGLSIYEALTSVVIKLRKQKQEFLNVYGFNMGLVTQTGLETGGFKVKGARKYAGIVGSDYENEAEDGRMALNLKTRGRLELVTNPKARVFTSPRRLLDDGSIWNAFINRVKLQLKNLSK